MDSSTGAEAEEQAAALDARLDEMVFRMQARVRAGEDVRASRRTRKVVRLSEEECKKIMAIAPWPPVMPPYLYKVPPGDGHAGLELANIMENVRRLNAEAVEHLKVLYAEWARVREHYAAHGYAEVAVEVDEHGVESIVTWEGIIN